jgi:hypothetical protein
MLLWAPFGPDEERYLGTKQDLVHAPNDGINFEGGGLRK